MKIILLKGGTYDGWTHRTDAKPGEAFWIIGQGKNPTEQYIVTENGLSAEVNE